MSWVELFIVPKEGVYSEKKLSNKLFKLYYLQFHLLLQEWPGIIIKLMKTVSCVIYMVSVLVSPIHLRVFCAE